mmetsp:Transcript_31551/g.86948  ORF Transcript_31551/g.86948 Transcript_31551/m.86948 type:complete len:254 (+) Transcript_31551:521-1282(+)|eukprot:CAMPEP_0117578460 /NCGR_PEP_ID=MMETSP0784-20121206/64023_1 /TAXON_ID=39447 /ORGANISM="" /LENGTH=253 /DNA_ID=CAMNT_0005378141 /DNA_START=439 /DNA_END=1200 /DNA_ORIENTATION=-
MGAVAVVSSTARGSATSEGSCFCCTSPTAFFRRGCVVLRHSRPDTFKSGFAMVAGEVSGCGAPCGITTSLRSTFAFIRSGNADEDRFLHGAIVDATSGCKLAGINVAGELFEAGTAANDSADCNGAAKTPRSASSCTEANASMTFDTLADVTDWRAALDPESDVGSMTREGVSVPRRITDCSLRTLASSPGGRCAFARGADASEFSDGSIKSSGPNTKAPEHKVGMITMHVWAADGKTHRIIASWTSPLNVQA